MNEKFEFTAGLKKNLFLMMGAGVLGLALSFFLYPENNHSRFWTNLLSNTYFFTGIGLFGLFVVAATQLAYGGWQTLMKRIFISLSGFTRIGGFLLLAIIALGVFGNVHTLYDHVKHILHTGAGDPRYSTKLIFFAPAFWIGRVLVYASLWLIFSIVFDRFFARTDQNDPKVYKKSKLLAAAFIVVFALTESAISWDAVMCLDPHWYSTLFGWYNFASYGCAAWGMTILIIIYLKSKGYVPQINENHIHDLGKMLFGFSIFWTYLWFDQFMLQWYANIPEDTNFWVKRFSDSYFKFTIFASLIINFAFPLFFLIKRSAKRNFKMIGFGAALLIFGHYVDFFNYTFVEPNWNAEVEKEKLESQRKGDVALFFAVNEGAAEAGEGHEAAKKEEVAGEHAQPSATESNVVKTEGAKETAMVEKKGKHEEESAPTTFAGIGIAELLIFVGFLGAFLFMFFNNLKKRPIVPENDPYLKESEKLTVTWA